MPKDHAALMEEAAVGITQFANDQPGFSAVLKHRYADFIVREIPVGAAPVQLTNLAALEQTTQVRNSRGNCMPCCSACSTIFALTTGSQDKCQQ